MPSGVPNDGSRNPGWANRKIGWGHNWKPASGTIPTPAKGQEWGAATHPPAEFSATNQPPQQHKDIGRVEAKEYREELKKRRAKGLQIIDKLYERALLPEADVQTLVAAARQHEANNDRLDGKPNQSMSGPEGGPIPTTMTVAFVKPNARDPEG